MKTAQAEPGKQVPQEFKVTLTREGGYKYLLYLPAGYDASQSQRWPLVLFMHGAGERGADLNALKKHGPPKLIEQGANLPFIVVSPQCPSNEVWQADVLLALVEKICADYRVDTKRVYATGLSMGGFASWSLAAKSPDKFAAIAPICGGGDLIEVLLAKKTKAEAMKTLGLWAFHGAKDPVVPLSESERMIAAFKKAGCTDIQLTVYPEAKHDSWTETYDNPKLFEWLLKHSRQ